VKSIVSRKAPVAIVLATVLALSAVAPAVAATTIYVTGKYAKYLGVSTARLTYSRSVNVSRLGKRSYSGKDSSYDYVVYLDCWGGKLTSGRNKGKYPLQMWSKKAKDGVVRCFQFTCFNGNYVTTKGVKVGSSDLAVRHAYGTALKKSTQPGWTVYTLNSAYRWRTQFYLPKSGPGAGKVTQIVIVTY
jgi:hypothetical protein